MTLLSGQKKTTKKDFTHIRANNAKMLGLYAHLAQWPCESYFQCASHVFSVTCQIYVVTEK